MHAHCLRRGSMCLYTGLSVFIGGILGTMCRAHREHVQAWDECTRLSGAPW